MRNNQLYAKTLFELTKNANCSSLVHGQLQSLEHLFNKVPMFRMVLVTKRLNNQDKIEITLKINQSLEKMIKKNPKQWFWSHNRWKQ